MVHMGFIELNFNGSCKNLTAFEMDSGPARKRDNRYWNRMGNGKVMTFASYQYRTRAAVTALGKVQ